jgi:hypothetical protein
MTVKADDIQGVKKILDDGEVVTITATQRRVGPGGALLTPTTIVCTNMRIIIMNRATLGFRNDYESIPYRQITSVRLENGIINGSVFIRVQGYDRDKGLLKNGREEGEIDGLRLNDARLIADYINKMMGRFGGGMTSGPMDQFKTPAATSDSDTVFCSKCGAPNKKGSAFCSKCGAKIGQ